MNNPTWQAVLSEAGAVFQENAIAHFGHPDAEWAKLQNDTILCDLSHLGLLEISGADALTFLQGQVTNDVTQLSGNNAHLSAYCTAKGRMLALFLVFAHRDRLHLQFPQTLLAPIAKRLSLYVLRAKVQVNDSSDHTVRFGINGSQAAAHLATALTAHYPKLELPTAEFGMVKQDNISVIKLPTLTGYARYQVLCATESAIKLWQALMPHCQPLGKAAWDWLDIQVGLPEIVPATQEQFVPQMLNLDLLNGINFKKGCYTGQEIVARTHYLGTVKRRTFLANIESQETPKAGDKVFDDKQNQVGMVVRTSRSAGNGFDVLVELRMDAQQADQVFWRNSKLKFKALPYVLEAA